ncbi:MAG: hypothetical protein HOO11_00335 [Candidatus Thioglobus sp.]|jgi:hypothetical protein|nr:hypothetical protein [Candidatus Thioglobus sp.]MBT4746428.1 hypothetical protein [Candidatus Thioglobus sp.]MBT6966214.1 hypothetical protein [Candidatus Thioglobus sp.]
MRVNGGMVLIISYIKIVFLTVFLLISTFAFSNSWILDKSDYENNQPSLRDCINIMKKGVLVDSKPINRNQPLETYIYGDYMYSVRWNTIEEMLVCYYDGKLIDSQDNKSQILPR